MWLLRYAVSGPGKRAVRQAECETNMRWCYPVGSQGDQLDAWPCEIAPGTLYRKFTPGGHSKEGAGRELICWHHPSSCFPLGNVLILTPLDHLASLVASGEARSHACVSSEMQWEEPELWCWSQAVGACGCTHSSLLHWQLWWNKWPRTWEAGEAERLWEGAKAVINEIIKLYFLLGSFVSVCKNI